MNKENMLNKMEMADVANERANFYSLLVRAFGNLPDDSLLADIRTTIPIICSDKLFRNFPKFRLRVSDFQIFGTDIKIIRDPDIIHELCADRIRIIKGLYGLGIKLLNNKPGYSKNENSSVLNIMCFPLEDNVVQDESASDLFDDLCIKLDYMSYLCREEQNQWTNQPDAISAISRESDFLREHFSDWVNEFCTQSLKYSTTGFYQGLFSILSNFICADLEYLNKITLFD